MTMETSNLLILEKSTKKDESKSESRKNFWRHCIPWRCNSDSYVLFFVCALLLSDFCLCSIGFFYRCV